MTEYRTPPQPRRQLHPDEQAQIKREAVKGKRARAARRKLERKMITQGKR